MNRRRTERQSRELGPDNALKNIRRAERGSGLRRNQRVERQAGEIVDAHGVNTGRVDRSVSGVHASFWTAKLPRRVRLARRFTRRGHRE